MHPRLSAFLRADPFDAFRVRAHRGPMGGDPRGRHGPHGHPGRGPGERRMFGRGGRGDLARFFAHGDLRLDNLLIGDAPDDLWVVDWQTTLLSNGVADASYFIGGNLTAEDRRTHEEALVRGYLGALRARGVEDLDWNECWRLYRHGVWHGVYLTVGASMLVEQTERGDLMFTTDLERHVRHAIDLEAHNVIGAPGA